MNALFSSLSLADVHRDLLRNIVSLAASQDLFDDLSGAPADWLLAQQVEDEAKPPPYASRTPVIDRPFEDAQWFNAIAWPFRHWQGSRFSDGSFGVWYGCDSVQTSVHETVHHWYHGLLRDAGFENQPVVAERKVYSVACDAALLDFRPLVQAFPALVHPDDYGYARSVGSRIHREGHPGLVTRSVRHPAGENYAVFNPAVLSNPRLHCQLSYRLDEGQVRVEKQPGRRWMTLHISSTSPRSSTRGA